jgi:hypothetical protein
MNSNLIIAHLCTVGKFTGKVPRKKNKQKTSHTCMDRGQNLLKGL